MLKRIGLALVALALLSTAAAAQSPAAAPAPSPDAAKIAWLEKMVKYLQGEVNALRTQVKQMEKASGGGEKGGPKSLDAKVAELTKKLESHTHEYLLEGRGADGQIQAVPQGAFPGSGLNSTGGARVGKAVIH